MLFFKPLCFSFILGFEILNGGLPSRWIVFAHSNKLIYRLYATHCRPEREHNCTTIVSILKGHHMTLFCAPQNDMHANKFLFLLRNC